MHLEYMRPVEDGPVTTKAADRIYLEGYSPPSVLSFLGNIRFFLIYLPYIIFCALLFLLFYEILFALTAALILDTTFPCF